MVSLKPFKGTRPFNEEAINIIAPSTDHLSEENIDLISNKNYWNYLKVLNPVGQLKESETLLAAKNHFNEMKKNKVIKQNKYFRLFATANTIGLGDTTGLYSGTNQINQAQMDRWEIVTSLNYLSLEKEMEIILSKNKKLNNPKGKEKLANMIKVASLTRKGFIAGDISTVMSPRTVLNWCNNAEIFKDTGYAFRVTFLNKCDDVEKNTIAEYYQRCFGEDLPESLINTQI